MGKNLLLYYKIKKEGNNLQYITNLDRKKLGEYESKLITEEVILTDERLYEHILLYHEDEYKQLRPYIKNIIENPDYYEGYLKWTIVPSTHLKRSKEMQELAHLPNNRRLKGLWKHSPKLFN